MPHNISSILDRGDFLSMMSRGPISCPVKNKAPIQVDSWDRPTIINSNHLPNYKDQSGEIVRRMMIIGFDNVIPDSEKDTNLKHKIIDSEFASFLHKCRGTYVKMSREHAGEDVSQFCPVEFLDRREMFREEVNMSYSFAKSMLEYTDNEANQFTWITRAEMTKRFRLYVKQRFDLQKTREKLNEADIMRADSRFKFIKLNLCKHCLNKHAKGCCKKYSRTARTTKNYFTCIAFTQALDGDDE
jgi:phage/plasmid-associated DNA primase